MNKCDLELFERQTGLREKIVFRIHAIRRMFERDISPDDVNEVIARGVVLESYPDDTPYPSSLILGWVDSRPLHVVLAVCAGTGEKIVITVYEPSMTQWNADFTRRKTV